MATDWKRLVQLREQHEQTAQQQLHAQGEALQASLARRQQAEQHLQAQHAQKTQLWHDARTHGPLAPEALRDAAAWSSALDRQIDQAALGVGTAQADLAQHQAKLGAARRALQAAAAHTHQAREMQARAARELQRRQARRTDSRNEELALQAWAMRHTA